MGSKNADSSSLLIKVTEGEDAEAGKVSKEEVAMTEEEVLEKAFEQFYKSAPKSITSPTRSFRVKGGDSKLTFNEITSRGTEESQCEVILSPNNFQASNEQRNSHLKLIDQAEEESLDKQLHEEGLGRQPNLDDAQIEQLQTKMERSAEQILSSVKKRRQRSTDRLKGVHLDILADRIIEQCKVAMLSIQ